MRQNKDSSPYVVSVKYFRHSTETVLTPNSPLNTPSPNTTIWGGVKISTYELGARGSQHCAQNTNPEWVENLHRKVTKLRRLHLCKNITEVYSEPRLNCYRILEGTERGEGKGLGQTGRLTLRAMYELVWLSLRTAF